MVTSLKFLILIFDLTSICVKLESGRIISQSLHVSSIEDWSSGCYDTDYQHLSS